MPQLIFPLMSTVALPELVPVRVPMLVPAPLLQTAEAPQNVDWTVTSAPLELTVPFVPEVQVTERLPLAMTVVVWVQLPNVRVLIGPLGAPVTVVVEPATVEVVHVSVVVPNSSLRSAEVPDFSVASSETALFWVCLGDR